MGLGHGMDADSRLRSDLIEQAQGTADCSKPTGRLILYLSTIPTDTVKCFLNRAVQI